MGKSYRNEEPTSPGVIGSHHKGDQRIINPSQDQITIIPAEVLYGSTATCRTRTSPRVLMTINRQQRSSPHAHH
ncbi:hypothetical protein RRG08_046376 [Elysia crispata]|uniref:Uncharacterized protein n=1 Tax=Elysia crispata TaxID=231223 RepID=A0AAE1AYB6_9GAST|nr:hypothetical protein RRG08_046376 [Elysia crispata]